MKSYRAITWFVVGFSLVSSACSSDPSCADLATCPIASNTPSSSSGTLGGVEICTNGIDDDGDGVIDCADADCLEQFTCVSAIPGGFQDILTINVIPYGQPTPSCDDGSEPKLYYQNPAEDLCDGCSCDTSGMSCTPAPLLVGSFFDSTCANPKPIGSIAPGQCAASNGSSAIVPNAPTANGSCKVQTLAQPLAPPMATVIATCLVTSAGGQGCGESNTCVPRDPLDSAEHICVQKEGHEKCPSDWPVAIHAFDSFTDDRSGCSPCSCAASCAGGTYTIFPNDGSCSAGGLAVDPVGTCVSGNGSFFGMGVTMSPLDLACTLTPGKMVGSVKPVNETTLCCK